MVFKRVDTDALRSRRGKENGVVEGEDHRAVGGGVDWHFGGGDRVELESYEREWSLMTKRVDECCRGYSVDVDDAVVCS